MSGKFHLAGPENNPFGYGGPHSIGFDYFYGWTEGEPYPVDTNYGMPPQDGCARGGERTSMKRSRVSGQLRAIRTCLPVPSPLRP